MKLLVVCLAAVAYVSAGDNFVGKSGNGELPWTYKDQSKWGGNCDKAGVQSPIDVKDPNMAVTSLDQRKTAFYDGKYEMIVSNNGRNLKMTFICCASPFIHGGALPDHEKYYFYYANIFVGKDSTSGSQHTFAGKGYAMEITLHSFKLTDDQTPEKNRTSAAVSLFYEETKEDNPALSDFISAVERVQKFDEVTSFKTDNLLAMFIPKEVHATYPNDYYTYEGSLTSPPCTDKVTYFLLRTPLKIGTKQLEVLRSVTDENGQLIAGNRRAPQDLGDRKVIKADPVNYIKW